MSVNTTILWGMVVYGKYLHTPIIIPSVNDKQILVIKKNPEGFPSIGFFSSKSLFVIFSLLFVYCVLY